MWALAHRPKKFADVIGQEWPTEVVLGALTTVKDMPKVWLLHGPWGSGKTSIARLFAKALICLDPVESGESCNACDQCQQFEADTTPNYLEVDAATNSGVQAARDIVEESRSSPVGGSRFRVVVIDEAQELTNNAEKAFLKAFEELSGKTVYILVTTDPERIHPTIRSRAASVVFMSVGTDTLAQHLEAVCTAEQATFDKEAVRLAAESCHGHVRDALTLVEKVALTGSITVDSVRGQLGFHLDDLALQLIGLVIDDWEAFLLRAEKESQVVAPSDLWSTFLRMAVTVAVKSAAPIAFKEVTTPVDEDHAKVLMQTSVLNWAMNEGPRLFVRSFADFVAAVSIFRHKMNVSSNQAGRDRQSGIPLGAPKSIRTQESKTEGIAYLTTRQLYDLFKSDYDEVAQWPIPPADQEDP